MLNIDSRLFKASPIEDGALATVGDPKAPGAFAPILTLGKWGGEHAFSLMPVDLLTGTSLTVTADQLAFGNAKLDYYFKDEGGENIKFGVILKTRPKSNVFRFSLGGKYADCEFLYQPALAHTDKDGNSWEISPTGGFRTRSAEHVGSYAVYHASLVDHIRGGTNYRTGKLGDFHRPRFVDALGKFVWADLVIDPALGTYTVTVPQDFLDSATYPIIANDTYGYTSIGSVADGSGATLTYYHQLNALSPAGTNTLTNISIASPSGQGNGTVKFALYTESGGVPNAQQVIDASAFAITDGAKFNTNPVAMSFSLTAATQYWTAIGILTGSTGVCWDTGGTKKMAYEAAAPPATASSTSLATNTKPSAYVTYTASGGATSNTPSYTVSFTPSYTPSSTPSFTQSFTPSQTVSFTPSQTTSFTQSFTPSFTQSRTQSFTPSFTPSASQTVSYTPSYTPSFTASRTISFTPSQTPSFTPSFTPSISQTVSYTPSYTPSFTVSFTPSFTPSFTVSRTPSFTPSQTPSPSATVSFTVSQTPSFTPSYTPSFTVSQTPSFTSSQTVSFTPSETVSQTPSQTLSFTQSFTPSISFTVSYTPSYTPSVTPSFTPSFTVSFTPSYTPSRTPSFTESYTPSATATPASHTPSQTVSQTPSQTASFTPSYTVSFTPSFTPSFTASFTPSQTLSFTSSYTPSQTISFTPSGTPSPSETVSFTSSFTPSQTAALSTPSFTPSNTPSPSGTPSRTPSHTVSHTASYTPSATLSATPSYGPPVLIDKLLNDSRFKYLRAGQGLTLEADLDTIYISLG